MVQVSCRSFNHGSFKEGKLIHTSVNCRRQYNLVLMEPTTTSDIQTCVVHIVCNRQLVAWSFGHLLIHTVEVFMEPTTTADMFAHQLTPFFLLHYAAIH